jgi:hypothetical protein
MTNPATIMARETAIQNGSWRYNRDAAIPNLLSLAMPEIVASHASTPSRSVEQPFHR